MKALSSTSVFPWEREEGRGTESFLIRIRMNAGNGGRDWCESSSSSGCKRKEVMTKESKSVQSRKLNETNKKVKYCTSTLRERIRPMRSLGGVSR